MTAEDNRVNHSATSKAEKDESLVLAEHHLPHFSQLSVDPSLFERRFASDSSMARCAGTCCRSGVWLDVAHRAFIDAHTDVIVRYMEPQQEHDPSRWFDDDELIDPDFESGRAYSTATNNGACVFLDGQRRCVLQRAQAEVPGLKPFYCFAYPIVIDNGVLTLDDDHCPEETGCCAASRTGSQSVLDVCAWELEYVLGKPGYEELRRLAETRATQPMAVPNDSDSP